MIHRSKVSIALLLSNLTSLANLTKISLSLNEKVAAISTNKRMIRAKLLISSIKQALTQLIMILKGFNLNIKTKKRKGHMEEAGAKTGAIKIRAKRFIKRGLANREEEVEEDTKESR